MRYSPLVERIAGEGAAAWEIHAEAMAAKRRGADVILLSVGDPDLDTPEPILDRAITAMRAGDTHYTSALGEPALREAIARQFRADGGWPAGPEHVCVVSGTQNGLFATSLLLLSAGDEVLVPEPAYVTYEATIRASGSEPVMVPPRPASGFRLDPDALAAAITPRTRAILIANPNNPTGVVLSRDELDAIAGLAKSHDLWVIADEVYASLTFDVPHQPIAGLPGMAERTVTVASLSKSHAMTGWRAGWMIGPQAFIDHAANLTMCMLYGLPGFIQQAAATALATAEETTAWMRGINRRRRDLMLRRLGDVPGLTLLRPDAGMFVMADVRQTGFDASAFAWRLLREQGVSVLDATAFGRSAAGHVRLSYTLDEATLSEACERIAAFVDGLFRERRAGRAHG